MKIKYFTLAFSFLLLLKVNSQNPEKNDSLKNVCSLAAEDSNKVNVLFKQGKQLDLTQSKQRIEIFIEALSLAKKLNYTNGLKKIYLPLISNLFYKEMYDVSLLYCNEYADFCEKQKLFDEKYMIYNMMGNLLTNQGKYEEALPYYHKKRSYDLQKEDYRSYAGTLNSMSVLFTDNKQYDSALVYSFWSAEIFKRNNMSDEIAGSVLGLAKVYLKKQDYEKAEQKANEALTLYTAISYKSGMCNSLYVLASVYAAVNKPEEAFNTYSKTLLFADSLGLVKMKRDCYYGLSEMYIKQNNYKDAFEYNTLTEKYNDSLSVSLQRGKMLELEVQYDLVKKENELKGREFEFKAKDREKTFLYSGIICFIIIVALMYRAFIQKS